MWSAMRSRAVRVVRRGMVYIQTEKTPNPEALKFVPSQPVLTDESISGFHLQRGDEKRSPLGKKLLSIDLVSSVFIGKDFVTVNKAEKGAWKTIKPMVFSHLMDWYAEGTPAVLDVVESDTAVSDDDSEVVAMIKELIEARIRPAVQDDGGDILFRGFDEGTGIVQVELAGSCVGCPSSSVTLRNGVENMLMHYIEEVKGIEQVGNDDDSDIFKLSFPSDDVTQADDPRVSI